MGLWFVPPSRERTESRGGRVGVNVEAGSKVTAAGMYMGPLTPGEVEAIREAGFGRGLLEADRRLDRHPDEDW